jgi:isocitrate dehydrogenase (NAD+)
MGHRVTLIPGDGTGPELTEATRRVLEATGVALDWDLRQAGVEVMEEAGTPLPDETLASVKENGVALKGPITTPIGTGFRSVNVALRHELELYACLRPCKTYTGVRTRYENVDVVVVRENTEDLYAGIEYEAGSDHAETVIATLNALQPKQIAPGSGISVKPMSAEASERIIRYAFEYALKHNRRKVTIVHKANILKMVSGLFLEVGRTIAKEYDGRIESNDMIVDNTAMQLVLRPEQFDVMVTTNMFGDILSDEVSGLVGGLGLAPGANIGTKAAIFEAVHGSAPDIAGKGIANPSAQMFAAAMMLDHLGELDRAERVRHAIITTIVKDGIRTRDLGGTASTEEFGSAVAKRAAA